MIDSIEAKAGGVCKIFFAIASRSTWEMSLVPATLSQSQVEILLTDPSPGVRAETAAGVAAELSKGSLTEN